MTKADKLVKMSKAMFICKLLEIPTGGLSAIPVVVLSRKIEKLTYEEEWEAEDLNCD